MSMDVGVGQLVEELEQRGDRLPFEIGAFVALEACEGLLQQSVRLEADDVRVTLEGSVVVAPSAERVEPDEAAQSLVTVLSRLLVAAGPGVPPYLLELVEEARSHEGRRDLRHLHDAIEASLIPLNRGASRRVLARLVRESDRPPPPDDATIDPEELDAELDELLGDPSVRRLDDARDEPETAPITVPRGVREAAAAPLESSEKPEEAETVDADSARDSEPAPGSVPPPVPPAALEPLAGSVVVAEQVRVEAPSSSRSEAAVSLPEQDESGEAVTATIRVRFPEEEPETAEVPVDDARPSSEPTTPPASSAEIESTTATTMQWAIQNEEPARVSVATPDDDEPRASAFEAESSPSPSVQPRSSAAPRRSSWVPWLLLLAAGTLVFAFMVTGNLERWIAPQSAGAPAPLSSSGTIEVTVDPPDAQVFVFVGRGPALDEGLSISGPHEFIVFDRGLRPSRGIVPQGAAWTVDERGAIYELALQADPQEGLTDSLSLGEPMSEPSGPGEQNGAVRIITNPQGAKVYRFVGLGPEVTIEASSIHEGQEILVYHPERAARRAVIGPSDWRGSTHAHRASLDVVLPARPSPVLAEPIED